MFERCHGSVVDQAPTWPKNNTPYSQTHTTRCISTRVWGVCVRLGTSRQHADAHSPRLSRLKGVMVVWWTKHQLGQKTTRHTPQGASRLVCGECACDVWHVHISPACIRPLVTSGTFER